MFESRLSEFAHKNNLNASVVQELVQIFNEALVEIGQGILKDVPTKPTTTKTPVKTQNKPEAQKWASKVAQAFAEEKEFTLDDFPGIEKVTKQHMLELLKKKDTQTTKQVTKESPSGSTSKDTPKRKVQCNGLTAKGDPCTRTGTVQPDGSKNCYCFRHADTWKDFETTVSSDSDSDDELVEEKIEIPVKESFSKDIPKIKDSYHATQSDSDDKLEEDYLVYLDQQT